MERCTLCGGKLRNGRCTECGLDNTKNDKKYRLNTHGSQDTVFRHGNCEDTLNTERKKSGDLWKDVKQMHGAGSAKGSTAKSKSKSESFDTDTSKRKGQSTASADTARRKKQLEQRSGTGTAKKRRGGVIRWIVILVILFEVFGNMLMDKVEEIQEYGTDTLGEVIRTITGYDDDSAVPEKPQEIIWNEKSQGYFEQGLAPGYYTVGYEIPAGLYQLYCLDDTAWCWYESPDGYRTYYTLYSTESQESYAESFGECGYYELSEDLVFEEGGVLCVEDGESGVLLKGEGEGKDSLKSHTSQHLSETVNASDGMIVGDDIQPGVYNIVLDVPTGEYGSAYLMINDADDDSYYIGLHEGASVFYRMNLTEGSTLELTKYGTDEDHIKVYFEPSY